jgi:hypothetical protein
LADYWSQNDFRSNANASVTQAPPAPTSSVRLRAIQLSGSGAIQILDGDAVIWVIELQSESFSASSLDIRASPGNAMTVQFTAPPPDGDTAVNVQGDFCAADSGYGLE